jgi:hypothetical protein
LFIGQVLDVDDVDFIGKLHFVRGWALPIVERVGELHELCGRNVPRSCRRLWL